MPGVYISYPFCGQKCSFCNFASDVATGDTRARYEAALLDEIRNHKWAWAPETVYWGGGTPSLASADFIRDVLAAIPAKRLSEVTLECAPGTITAENVAAWRAHGINRVSLGVQSFVQAELRQTGRRHTVEIVAQDVALLRRAGILNLNLDLIAGLPEQTTASWEKSLDWIQSLAPPHVSVYLFEIDEDSRLGREILLGGQRYGAAVIPSDDTAVLLYERAIDRLAGAGLRQYEISNFARPGFESRHNLKYWQLEPYIGFGLDAHSFDGKERWSNPESLADYLSGPHSRQLSKRASDLAEEHFFVGLRLTAGIEPTADEWARWAEPIDKWTSAGMLERDGSRLRLTPRAVLVSNEILQEFLHV